MVLSLRYNIFWRMLVGILYGGFLLFCLLWQVDLLSGTWIRSSSGREKKRVFVFEELLDAKARNILQSQPNQP